MKMLIRGLWGVLDTVSGQVLGQIEILFSSPHSAKSVLGLIGLNSNSLCHQFVFILSVGIKE